MTKTTMDSLKPGQAVDLIHEMKKALPILYAHFSGCVSHLVRPFPSTM